MLEITASETIIGQSVALELAGIKNAHREYSTRMKRFGPSQDNTTFVRSMNNEIHRVGGGTPVSVKGEFDMNPYRGRALLVTIVVALIILWGCTTTPRLNIKFDADALGSPPATAPPPNPPGDSLSFTVFQLVTSTIVTDPAGGRWLRISPTPAFLASPDFRKRAIIATSEPFTASPPAQIRGHLRLRLDGLGIVTVGFRPVQGAQSPDFISGVQVASFALPGGPRGEAHVLNGFSLTRIDDIFQLPVSGKMADYQPGTAVDIFWSIDQASRTFAASASGGISQTTAFTATSAGTATTPIQQLSLWVWLQNPSSNTVVFIDNLFAEEYR
jgi:hypothetical protein